MPRFSQIDFKWSELNNGIICVYANVTYDLQGRYLMPRFSQIDFKWSELNNVIICVYANVTYDLNAWFICECTST